MNEQFRLREWQVDALTIWDRDRRGTVEVATGGGKTVFALACWLRVRETEPSCQAVVVVPTRALADQWCVAAIEDAGVPESEVRIQNARLTREDLVTFNVIVINSARSVKPETWPALRMLIVDECHRAGSPENSKALLGPSVASLGLSATPERQYDEGFDRIVAPAIGGIIFTYTLQDALRDGVLSPFDLENVRVPLLDHEQVEYERLTNRVGRLMNAGGSEEAIAATLRRRASMLASAAYRIPTAVALVEKSPNSRTLVFHESIAAADRIAEILAQRGHSVALYHSGLGDALRRSNLLLFRRGIVQILVTCRALDEGANIPETTVAIVAASTASLRQRIQRLGRVLRPAPGKEFATVYTIYASPTEEDRLIREAEGLTEIAAIRWSEVGV